MRVRFETQVNKIYFQLFEFYVCFVNELEFYYFVSYNEHNYAQQTVFFVLYAEQRLNCLRHEFFTSRYFHSGGLLIVFRCAWKVKLQNFVLCVVNK